MSFETQLLQFLSSPGYQPMKQHELAHALNVDTKGKRSDFRHELYAMEAEGKIARLRKNRWALPNAGNEVIGTLRMLPKAAASLSPKKRGSLKFTFPNATSERPCPTIKWPSKPSTPNIPHSAANTGARAICGRKAALSGSLNGPPIAQWDCLSTAPTTLTSFPTRPDSGRMSALKTQRISPKTIKW